MLLNAAVLYAVLIWPVLCVNMANKLCCAVLCCAMLCCSLSYGCCILLSMNIASDSSQWSAWPDIFILLSSDNSSQQDAIACIMTNC